MAGNSDDSIVSMELPDFIGGTPDILRKNFPLNNVGHRTPTWANGTPMLNDLVRGFAEGGGTSGSNPVNSNGFGKIGEGGLMAQMMADHDQAVRAEMLAENVGPTPQVNNVGVVPGAQPSGAMDGMWALGLHDMQQQNQTISDMADCGGEPSSHMKILMDASDASSGTDAGQSYDSDEMFVENDGTPVIDAKKEDVLLHVQRSDGVSEKNLGVKKENVALRPPPLSRTGSGGKRRKKVIVPHECPAVQAKKNRAEAIKRLKQKKLMRTFNKKVRYQCRKKIALHRPRVRGRFATKEEVERFKAEE